MEALVKKYLQKYKRVKDEMNRWDELQSQLVSQFRNASSIIERLPAMQDIENYGSLKCITGIKDSLLQKQMESLVTIMFSMKKTLKEFQSLVSSLERIHREGRQLVNGGSKPLNITQMRQRVGVKPCLADCVDGLQNLHEMHHDEYRLKCSLISSLDQLVLKPSPSDLAALERFLVDQPNIPKEEVKHIFDIIFAEENL